MENVLITFDIFLRKLQPNSKISVEDVRCTERRCTHCSKTKHQHYDTVLNGHLACLLRQCRLRRQLQYALHSVKLQHHKLQIQYFVTFQDNYHKKYY